MSDQMAIAVGAIGAPILGHARGARVAEGTCPLTKESEQDMTLYGTALPRNEYERQHDRPRSVVGEITRSVAGNVVLRVGREHVPGGTWSLTEHVVLTRDEALELAAELSR